MDVILAWNPDEKPDDAPDERRCTISHLSPLYIYCDKCLKLFRSDFVIQVYLDYGDRVYFCEPCAIKLMEFVKKEEEEAEV